MAWFEKGLTRDGEELAVRRVTPGQRRTFSGKFEVFTVDVLNDFELKLRRREVRENGDLRQETHYVKRGSVEVPQPNSSPLVPKLYPQDGRDTTVFEWNE